MFHEDALYQVYESLALPLPYSYTRTSRTHVTVITTALCLHGLQRCSHFSCSAVSFADVCVCVLRVNTNLRQYRPFSIHSSPTVYTVIVLISTGVSLRPDPFDLWVWPLPVFEIVSPTAVLIFRQLNMLDFHFVATLYGSFERSYSQKTILTFWPLVTLTLGQAHSKSNRLVPGLCPTTP